MAASDGDTWFGIEARVKPLAQAGVALGVGLGGFVDGIVLHQLLQVHHLVSARTSTSTVAGLETNVLADGLFHVGTYVAVVVGLVLLVRAWRRPGVPPSTSALVGSVAVGWGVFNLLEGVVNHHLLELHQVWPAGPGGRLLWDLAFLLSGVVLLGAGYALLRRGAAASTASVGPDLGEDTA